MVVVWQENSPIVSVKSIVMLQRFIHQLEQRMIQLEELNHELKECYECREETAGQLVNNQCELINVYQTKYKAQAELIESYVTREKEYLEVIANYVDKLNNTANTTVDAKEIELKLKAEINEKEMELNQSQKRELASQEEIASLHERISELAEREQETAQKLLEAEAQLGEVIESAQDMEARIVAQAEAVKEMERLQKEKRAQAEKIEEKVEKKAEEKMLEMAKEVVKEAAEVKISERSNPRRGVTSNGGNSRFSSDDLNPGFSFLRQHFGLSDEYQRRL